VLPHRRLLPKRRQLQILKRPGKSFGLAGHGTHQKDWLLKHPRQRQSNWLSQNQATPPSNSPGPDCFKMGVDGLLTQLIQVLHFADIAVFIQATVAFLEPGRL
jgi:hypothetical protein